MFSEIEYKVMRVAELSSGLSYDEVAKRAGCKPHQARYAVAKFTRLDIIQRRVFINTYSFGLERYAIFFTLSTQRGALRKSFIEYLKRSPNVVLLLEIGGEFQFEINVVAYSLREFISFITDVAERFSNVIANRIISTQVEHRFFGTKILAPNLRLSDEPRYGVTDHIVELDDLDKRLLSAAAALGELRFREIARQLGAPTSTVEQRMKKLVHDEVITGSTSLFEGIGIHEFILLLYTQGSDTTLRRDLLAFCRSNARVHFFVESLGNWDFELGIAVKDPIEVTHVIEELYDKFRERIVGFKSLPLFKRHKIRDFQHR
jgi:DNA-binding Lrp family transcriptional regulator